MQSVWSGLLRSWQENYRGGGLPFPGQDKGGCLKPHHAAELTLTIWPVGVCPVSLASNHHFHPMQWISIFCRGNCALYYTNILIKPPLTCLSICLDGWQGVVLNPHHSSVLMCSFYCNKVFLSFILVWAIDSFFTQCFIILN